MISGRNPIRVASALKSLKSVRKFSAAPAQGKKVGFIGLGNMGLSMAGNLVKHGYVVKGFDVNAEPMGRLADIGVAKAASLSQAAENVDYIITCLPKTHDVRGALESAGGIFASAAPNTMILDTSTISPVDTRELNAAAESKGLVFLDSPMVGGTKGATNGTLTFMVGAQDGGEQFERAKTVLAGMGKNLFACGGAGSGQATKISHNMILGINMIAASEGLALGEKLGIDPKILSEILSASTSGSACVRMYHPRPGVNPESPSSRDYEGGFQVGLLRKDLALAQEAAAAADASADFGAKALDYYTVLENNGFSQKDFGYAFQYVFNNLELKDKK